MATVKDIAAYVLARQGSATAWELQKLVYYAHGWAIAWDGIGLVDEGFEAWKHGPVSRRLYAQHPGRHRLVRGELGEPAPLSETQRTTIDAVLEFYGELGAENLVALSHRERPWREARGHLPPEARSDAAISSDSIRAYFSRLAAGHPARRIPDEVRSGVRMALDLPEDELDALDTEREDDLVGDDAATWLASLCPPA